ncbi:DivIVA domain-containing protein [Raineya sp.]|jgi:cell division initiation protein
MKITPIEIRQKTFEKKAFGGYDKDEVTAFLQALSQEWEKLNNELRETKIRLEIAEKEVSQLRQVESSLFKTLKTAEDTGSHIVEQAKRDAELKIKEAQLKADDILNDARLQAKTMIQKADVKAKSLMQDAINEMKNIRHECLMLDSYRDNLITDLKNWAYSMLDKVSKSEERNILETFDSKIKEAEAILEKHQQEIEQLTEKYSEPSKTTEEPPKENLANFF